MKTWAPVELESSIFVEFRLIMGSRDGDEIPIFRAKMPAVPLVGQTINLDGDPFVVADVGWAAGPVGGDEEHLHAYVRVSPYSLSSAEELARRLAKERDIGPLSKAEKQRRKDEGLE